MAKYLCEIPGCTWKGSIRSKVKNRASSFYGLRVCPYHARVENGYLDKKYPLKKMTAKTRGLNKEKQAVLKPYFEHHQDKLYKNPVSEASGELLYAPFTVNICHIFPKRIYKSVQDNLLNCVYLTWQEHQDFDRMLDVFDFRGIEKKFPKLWEIVLKRAKDLLPLVEENKKLKTELNKIINGN